MCVCIRPGWSNKDNDPCYCDEEIVLVYGAECPCQECKYLEVCDCES